MNKPDKKGQIVKFHSPLPDEDPNQKFEVLDIHFDVDNPRADIKAIETGLQFPPINTVPVEDLEVIEG